MKDDAGNPGTIAELRKEKAGATTTGIRSPYRQAMAPNMKPERMARILRAADDGDTDAYFTLAAEIEERDLHYGAVLTMRKFGVTSIPATIQAATEKRRDVKIAEDVQGLVSEPAFNELVFHVLDALGKGISFTEIIWESSASQWRPSRYEPRDQRWFTWDSNDLRTPLLKSDERPNGEPLAPFKWIVHTPLIGTNLPMRAGLARAAIIAWCLKSYTASQWMQFLEVYGMPLRVGKYPDGTKQEDRDALREAIATLGSDAAGIIHEKTSIEFIATNARGGAEAFLMTAEYWDKQISKRVLGQTMTTDEGTGRGKAQAATQEKQEMKINRHDAARVAATLRAQLITPYVRLNYGDTALVPGIKIETKTATEIDVELTNIERLVKLGGRVEEAYVRDLLSLPEPAEGATLLTVSASPAAVADPNAPQDPAVTNPGAGNA